MTAAELRAEAQRSDDMVRHLGGPYPQRLDHSVTAPGSAESLSQHHEARARLFDRCAEAADGMEP